MLVEDLLCILCSSLAAFMCKKDFNCYHGPLFGICKYPVDVSSCTNVLMVSSVLNCVGLSLNMQLLV